MVISDPRHTHTHTDTGSFQTLPKQDGRNIYVFMKTMRPRGYHHNGFMTIYALGNMTYGFRLHYALYSYTLS